MNALDLERELADGEKQGVGEIDIERLGFELLGGGEPRMGEYTGVKALMVALLEEGVQSYLSSVRRVREDAEHWIMSRRQSWPFAFNVVCDTLGLEPNAVRNALIQLREKPKSRRPIARTRPNVRRMGRLVVAEPR